MENVFKFKYKGYTFIPVGQISPKMSLKKASLYKVGNIAIFITRLHQNVILAMCSFVRKRKKITYRVKMSLWCGTANLHLYKLNRLNECFIEKVFLK